MLDELKPVSSLGQAIAIVLMGWGPAAFGGSLGMDRRSQRQTPCDECNPREHLSIPSLVESNKNI